MCTLAYTETEPNKPASQEPHGKNPSGKAGKSMTEDEKSIGGL